MLRERRRLAHYKLSSRLDRKSSRGMIYENEELRLRTININAEVERGQSDIKRLRRENEQLRREIWTLRDECDRLNKRFKAKLLDHEHCNRHSVCSGGGRGSGHICDSNCNSDDSDSCDTCKGNDDQCSDECCTGGSCPQLATKQPIIEFAPDTPTTATAPPNFAAKAASANSESVPNLHQAFDHLSVVSEETMSNADQHTHVPHNELLHIYTSDGGGSQMALPSLVGPLTPLTPIEQVANQLNDLQAVVPPLSYFENVLHDHMGSNIGNTPNTSSPTSKVMRHTNGWDYKLQSPFAHRKTSTGASPPALQIATPLTQNSAQQQPLNQQRLAPPPQLLTTFVPTIVAPPACNESSANCTSRNATAPHTTAAETVAITTTPSNALPSLNSPRHFFAPLKPRLKINTTLANKVQTGDGNAPTESTPQSTSTTSKAADAVGSDCFNCEPPDLYVHNGLASPYQQQQALTAAPGADNAVPPPIPQRGSSSQTESVNLETILNDIQAISEDILAIQLDKRRENDSAMNKPLEPCDKNKKPYRSEMNLTLQYDGANQPLDDANTTANSAVTTAIATQTSFHGNASSNNRCTRSLERDHTDSPSPHIPDAMVPFPDNRTYIGFDQLNNEACLELPPTSVANMQRPPLPPVSSLAKQSQPPTSPARGFPSPLNIRCAGVARATPVAVPQPPTDETAGAQPVKPPMALGLAPNKSQLYTAVANAAARRAQYRAATAHSLDIELNAGVVTAANETNAVDVASEALANEAARRKARRVSIVCGDSSTPDSPDAVTNTHLVRSQAQINLSGMQDAGASNATANNSNLANTTNQQTIGSCTDLQSALLNPALRNLKQTSHSTPNSPHSARRRSNSNTMSPNNGVAEPTHPQSLSANTSPKHAAYAHHRHTNSSCSNIAIAHQRKSSQDSTRTNTGEVAAAEAVVGRSRCSRRHSDGTVASNAHRVSGTSGHHHHHHHHHQHTASMLSNSNLHHSHHSHQDSTSYSEHGSNSSASSRESSAAFSVRSHRRKISISSHTGGKIPWCGCWGNGCL